MALTIEQWLPKWKKRVRDLESENNLTPAQVARWGANKGKTLAPVDTGTLVQAIAWKTIKSNKKPQAFIWVRPMTNPKGGKASKYSYIHHKDLSLRARRGGDLRWMFTVQKLAKEKFETDVRGHITKFIKGG